MRPSPDLNTFGVYDGRERVGTVVEVERGAAAFDALGRPLGSHKKRKEAVAAIPVPPVAGAAPAPSQQGGA